MERNESQSDQSEINMIFFLQMSIEDLIVSKIIDFLPFFMVPLSILLTWIIFLKNPKNKSPFLLALLFFICGMVITQSLAWWTKEASPRLFTKIYNEEMGVIKQLIPKHKESKNKKQLENLIMKKVQYFGYVSHHHFIDSRRWNKVYALLEEGKYVSFLKELDENYEKYIESSIRHYKKSKWERRGKNLYAISGLWVIFCVFMIGRQTIKENKKA